MKSTVTALLFIVLICFFAPRYGPCAEISAEEYLKDLSVFTETTRLSVRDLVAENLPPPTEYSTYDPFPYIPHGSLDVPEGIRLMVFAPHPDDEAISSSGLVQRVIARGGSVRIVLVTNGDGYTYALKLLLQNRRIFARDYVDLGKRRQAEAVEAACELGLKPDEVIFLGYPDGGIDDLWETYWSNLKPFISPHTLFDRPYRKGPNRWVKYCGMSLEREISSVMLEFSPDWIVLPDPRDEHLDHATAGVFVMEALRENYHLINPSLVLSYLVHFMDFPTGDQWSKGISGSGIGGGCVSKVTLSNSQWVSLQLSPEEVEGKRRAMISHASQLQMLHWFFRNFLLPSEIFARLDMTQVLVAPQEYAAHHKHFTNELKSTGLPITP